VYLGQLADPSSIENLAFEYFNFESGVQTVGSVLFAESVAPPLPGDYNGDLAVDAVDYTVWRNSLGATPDSFQGADGNGDGSVDSADYKLWKRQYGKSIQLAGLSAEIELASVENDVLPSTPLRSADDAFAQSASANLGILAQATPIAVGPRIERHRAALAPHAADDVLSSFEARQNVPDDALLWNAVREPPEPVVDRIELIDAVLHYRELKGGCRPFDFEDWDNPIDELPELGSL
jgi:hypothetical protein